MSKSKTRNDYRPDIDGLRAIAVLSVLIFHARDSALPGGFVGVDIFFVISGFLISRHIAAEVASHTFSLLEFYRRRIRRIAPMMMTVLAATLVASFLLMTPEDASAVAKSAVWSIASMANIYFWRELDTGYFANSSAEVPLLHLWSLGVEEQFYLIWPVLISFAIRRLRPATVLLATLAVAVLSFQLAAMTFARDVSFTYYMLPTRAGELLLGALFGMPGVLTSWRITQQVARVASWLGVALIAVSLWIINPHDPFPGWLALPPTLGAALMLVAGEHPAGRLAPMMSKPAVFVGKISYSAYLWHWPLFALFRYCYGEPDIASGVALLTATLLLAWLSFEFIERPTRHTAAPIGSVALRQFVVPAVALLIPALWIVYGDRIGVPTASPTYLAQLGKMRETGRPAYTFDWVCQRQRLSIADANNPNCVLGASTTEAPRALLWGDSNAAHYIPMVKALAEKAGTRFRNLAVGSCPPLLSDPKTYVDAGRLADCSASAEVVRAEIDQYPVIIISAAWSSYQQRSPDFLEKFAVTLRELTTSGHTVVLVGRAPILNGFDRRCKEKALRVPFKDCDDSAQPLSDEVTGINARLQMLATDVPNASYFDPNVYLCPNESCSQTTTQGLPRFFDASHLTVAGSADLGRRVISAVGLPEAFQALRH